MTGPIPLDCFVAGIVVIPSALTLVKPKRGIERLSSECIHQPGQIIR